MDEELKKIIEKFFGFELPDDIDWENVRVSQYGMFSIEGYEPFLAEVPNNIEMN